MVRYCYICKVYSHQPKSQGLSFHRLPNEPSRRAIWISLLGFEKNHPFPKYVDICSKHFHENDFVYLADGVRHLRVNAAPVPVHSAFDFAETISSESSLSIDSDSPDKRATVSSSEPQSEVDILAIVPDEVEPVKKRLKFDEDFNLPGPSSQMTSISVAGDDEDSTSTITLSETEDQLCNVDKTGPPKSDIQANPSVTIQKKKRKSRYVGDMSSDDFSSPGRAKKNFRIMKEVITSQRRKIHGLQRTVTSLRKRVSTLNGLINLLKKKSYISESSEDLLKASLSGSSLKIFERLLKGPSTQKYDPALRSFALTLSFYSPRAYNFVRSTFNKSLPHLSTLSKWYRSVDGSPGFTQESLLALKLKNEYALSQNKSVYCNLVLDEMSIRRQVEWTGSKFSGYIDIGSKIDSDILPEAKEALVFMLVCINGSWKIPVGYFFIDGLSGKEKAELVNKCLVFINESGVKVTSLTFDGAPVNFTMASHLGANFNDIENMKTHFSHPVTGCDVFIILDPCHMIKLVRNTFGSQKYFTDGEDNHIDWNFLVKLVDTQYAEGLHLGTKITIRHMHWVREKMKVKIATQTLSRSVSDALLYLSNDLKLPNFRNADATAVFIRKFNDLFDSLNSRNRLAKYKFKRPLSPATVADFFSFFDDVSIYIKNLKLASIPIIESPRKTGFLGFLICINSIKGLYKTYILKNELKYILTNKLSQDHLELFFGAIRGKGGFNNNPSARHFESAYKRLLIHTEVTGPKTGNITVSDRLTILSCGSGRQITATDNGDDLLTTKEYLDFEQSVKDNLTVYQSSSSAWNLTVYTENVVQYISGFVVKTLKKCVTCAKCAEILESATVISSLQKRKQYGNLVRASDLVINVCTAAERYFRFFHKTTNIFNKNIRLLIETLKNNTIKTLPSAILNHFNHHLYDDDPVDGHAIQLIKLILNNYFKLRIHHETAKNMDLSTKNRVRSILTKTILFKHE
ncbi:unnamed protein product [Callosobruchus maculatus]|uniref:THAP-type domain-containing protein n=1 Tax=Callosobruchus maculatus TaxID=64391 RepID=A0A653CA36_CALMS|nr:unnamed protein product [Callosobruchus maculatus]